MTEEDGSEMLPLQLKSRMTQGRRQRRYEGEDSPDDSDIPFHLCSIAMVAVFNPRIKTSSPGSAPILWQQVELFDEMAVKLTWLAELSD